MFTLTNPFLLWAFPVLILPWIFRRRQEERIQKIEFSLIRFLMESEEKDLINPRLQEFLLLLLRTLLLLLLLLALAGPKWTQENDYTRRLFSFLPMGASVQSSVVVIDSSYSLAYGKGESSWWSRSLQAAEQVNRELAGFNTSWVWWNQDQLTNRRDTHIPTYPFSVIQERYETAPHQPGTSVTEMLAQLQRQLSNQERLIFITDGQRAPWRDLLEANGTALKPPPLLVIPVGEPPAQNAWVELDEITSPPWGIAVAESVSGSVYGSNINENAALSVYDPASGKSLYSQSVQIQAVDDAVTRIAFQFNLDLSSLDLSEGGMANPRPSDAVDLSASSAEDRLLALPLTVSLEIQDGLALDNQLEMEVPVLTLFQPAVAYDPALEPVELRFILSALQNPDGLIPLTPDALAFSNEIDIAILAEKPVSWWKATDTTQTLEYTKNGGHVLLFTGAKPSANTAWNNLLEELGWSWSDTQSPGDLQGLSVSQGGALGDALAAWNLNMWDAWLPGVHGRFSREGAQPIVSYPAGDESYSLLAELRSGKGKVWIINADLQSGADNVWSPLLPTILWETGKEAVRSKFDLKPTPLQPRWESDLTLLTPDDRALLQERYGIQFADPEAVSRELQTVYGGLDLRYVLLMLTLFTALVESWLSNRLASL